MRPPRVRVAAALAVAGLTTLTFAQAGCSPAAPPPSAPGVVVVGIQEQPGLRGITLSYRVIASVSGSEVARTILSKGVLPDPSTRPSGAPMSDAGGDTPLPYELKLTSPESDAAAEIVVVVEAFTVPLVDGEPPPGGGPVPVLTRVAQTTFVPGETKLLRVLLEAPCLTNVPGFSGPTCTFPQSCQSNRCADGTVGPRDLEPYTATWAVDGPDICKPAGAGAPEIVLGTGQTDYMPLMPEQTLQAERGPQGGHHLWISVRMKNLKQSGSTTSITAVQPETGIVLPPTSFVFTYDRDEGGYCKISGLRYQLDNAANPVETFLGKPLDLTVEVRDQAGANARATVRVNVAATLRG